MESPAGAVPVFTSPVWSGGVFTAHVSPAPQGGWVAVLHLGDGATLSKWFPDEHEARRYPLELAEWLNQRCSAL